MKFLLSQNLFQLNQELSSLCATSGDIYSKVECLCLSENEIQQSYPSTIEKAASARNSSYANASAAENGIPSPRHFSILSFALSNSFPDFDFSGLVPWDFKLIPSIDQARQKIHWDLTNAITDTDYAAVKVWQSIDAEILTAFSDIYIYDPTSSDIFSEFGALWSRNYFFVNEKQKKVLLFHIREGAHEFESMSEDDQQNEELTSLF